MKQCGSVYKPFTQSLYIDLDENPSTPPTRIHLGFKLGRYHLRFLLESLEEIGVDHVILNLKYGKCPAAQVIEEPGVLTSFRNSEYSRAPERIDTPAAAGRGGAVQQIVIRYGPNEDANYGALAAAGLSWRSFAVESGVPASRLGMA